MMLHSCGAEIVTYTVFHTKNPFLATIFIDVMAYSPETGQGSERARPLNCMLVAGL